MTGKDVLGMWVGENESAKFWATVLNGLRNRGVEDIFIACTDNLTGFDTAIHAVFPETEIQNCMIHQLRNSSKYVSYKDLKALMSDLKAVYAAGEVFALQDETAPAIAQAVPEIANENLRDATEAFQRQMITRALEQNNRRWAACARALEMDVANLHRLAKRLGLKG